MSSPQCILGLHTPR